MPQTVYGKVIRPKEFNMRAFLSSLESVMHLAANTFESDFSETAKTWKDKPPFEKKVKTTGAKWEAATYTESELYHWITRGTGERGGGSKYDIWPGAVTGKSDKTMLFFASQFTPKTQPGIIGSNPGFVGKRDTLVPHVEHPGIEPRNFDKEIKKKREKWFADEVSRAMYDAGFRSGHGVR